MSLNLLTNPGRWSRRARWRAPLAVAVAATATAIAPLTVVGGSVSDTSGTATHERHVSTSVAAPGGHDRGRHQQKPRIIVMEDAEVDDMDSLIRLLYYSNEFTIEGIVATSSRFHYKGNMSEGGSVAPYRWTGVSWVNRYIDLYQQILPNLRRHASGWPSAEHLRSVYNIGNVATVGDTAQRTDGSEWIKRTILDGDPAPVYALAWGGTNTLARALQDIQSEYQGTQQWDRIRQKVNSKLIVYNILTQDDTLEGYIKPNWPDVKVIDNTSQFWGFAYLWPRATPDDLQKYLQQPYMEANLLKGTGPLMAEYRTYGDGNPTPGDNENLRWNPANIGDYSIHDFISEGDSPSFMFLLNFNGLRSAEDPTWGGWGGRFAASESGWIDTGDPLSNPDPDGDDLRYAQLRWLAEIQNDFAARIQWGVTPRYSEANHLPSAHVRGGVDLDAVAGRTVTLNARAWDPDRDDVSVSWWEYTDADTYPGTTPVPIRNADTLRPSFTVPEDAAPGDTLHVILQVTDDGSPALTTYQRVVVTVVDDHCDHGRWCHHGSRR